MSTAKTVRVVIYLNLTKTWNKQMTIVMSSSFKYPQIRCVKSVKILSFVWSIFSTPYLSVFSPNARKYRPEKTLYLDTFHAVNTLQTLYNQL